MVALGLGPPMSFPWPSPVRFPDEPSRLKRARQLAEADQQATELAKIAEDARELAEKLKRYCERME
jgi:hypothetical protein